MKQASRGSWTTSMCMPRAHSIHAERAVESWARDARLPVCDWVRAPLHVLTPTSPTDGAVAGTTPGACSFYGVPPAPSTEKV